MPINTKFRIYRQVPKFFCLLVKKPWANVSKFLENKIDPAVITIIDY